MPIDIQRNVELDKTNQAAKRLFAEGILSFLRQTPERAYSSHEIAQGLRAKSGVSEELKAFLDILGLFSREISQINTTFREEFEAVINHAIDERRVGVIIENGTAYFYIGEKH